MSFELIKTDQSGINKKLDTQVSVDRNPLPKTSLIWVISAARGLGKTTLMLNAMNSKRAYKKYFDRIYLISPTASKDPKLDKLVEELSDEKNYYRSLDDETLTEIKDKIDSDLEEDPDINSLLIIDDCIHQLPGNGQKNSVLNELITTSRHLRLTIIITTQKFTYVNTLIRNNTDIFSVFQTDKVVEKKAFLDAFNIPEEVYKFACDEPNNFLHVNMFGNKKTYYKNFDRIKF